MRPASTSDQQSGSLLKGLKEISRHGAIGGPTGDRKDDTKKLKGKPIDNSITDLQAYPRTYTHKIGELDMTPPLPMKQLS